METDKLVFGHFYLKFSLRVLVTIQPSVAYKSVSYENSLC